MTVRRADEIAAGDRMANGRRVVAVAVEADGWVAVTVRVPGSPVHGGGPVTTVYPPDAQLPTGEKATCPKM